MKKLLLSILITLFVGKINAQCTVATPTVSENFNSTVLPTCWTNLNGWSLSGTDIWATEDNNWTPMLILPKTNNAKGILTFKARMNSAFGPPAMYIGVVSAPGSPASYVNIFNFNVTNATMTSYTVDLSSYTGNFQYIAIRLPSNNARRLHIDDINYVSACFSSSVIAIAQNYTVQLNSNGQNSITGSNIDNGSTTTCGAPTLSVSPSFFDCSNVGINTVTLTASDNNGHSSFTTASVTILPAINNETVSVSQNTICSGNSATITTGASINGVKYYLRDDATNAIVAGPTIGTGNTLAFYSGSLTANTTFNVYAETPGTSLYALDFDGSNDVITTNITSPATNSLTIEAWIFPRATTYKRIISSYTNNGATSGEFLLDTGTGINNGKGLRFIVEGAGNILHSLALNYILTLNAWNHVAGTFNNGVTTLYVNGTAVATSTAPFTSIPSCTNKITIGEDPTIGALEYFNGKMDEVRIWNTARTQTEIAGNMNNCLVGNESGLRNYFKLNENIGSTVTDLVTGAIGNMSGMDPNTDWTVGIVDCGAPICNLEMTDLVTINIAPNPTIAVNSGTICSGNSFTITPSGANTYTIQGGSAVKTPTANASYTVTGTSSAGCVSSTFATSSITVNTTPTITVNSGNICSGQSFTITPGGANTYSIQGGNTLVSPTSNTSYTVLGSNSNGCVSNTFATSNVTVNPLPTINANSGTICSGQSFTITPTGANTYTIQGGSAIKTPTATTNYTVSGTSAAGCISSTFATSSITVNTTPTITVNSGSICSGQSFTITPGGANTYTFSNGNVVNPTTNTTYTVTGTGLNGCVNSTGVISSVTVNTTPTITIANGAICLGNSFTLSPSGANSFTFSSGSSIVSPTTTTSYSVSGTSSAGCITNTPAIVTVTVASTLNVTITGSNTICGGDVVNLTANGATTYTWSTGAISSTIAPSPASNTTYSVIGASGSCSNTAVISVTVNTLPTINATTSNTLMCTGQIATLTASGASTYTWNPGGASASISVSPTVTTTYTIDGTDANGCSNMATVTQSVSLCTGINQITNSTNAMTLFPNPCANNITVQTDEDIQVAYIFNTLGGLVQTENTKTFSVEKLSSGIYIMHVKTEKGIGTIRFIKE